MFKRINNLSLIAVAISIFAISPLIASANSPSDLTPQQSPVFMRLNSGNPHPLQNQLLETFQLDLLEETNTPHAQILLNNFENTTIGFGFTNHKQTGEELFYLSKKINQSDFDQIVADFQDQITEIDAGINKTIYQSRDDMFFAYINGYALFSNKQGIISDLLNNANFDSLAESANYQKFKDNVEANSFLDIFINFKELAKLDDDLNSPLLNSIEYEGISLSQINNNLMAELVIGLSDDSELKNISQPFTPELFQELNHNNLIFFTESFDYGENLKYLFLESEEEILTQAELNEFQETMGISFSQFLELMNNNLLIAVHNNTFSSEIPVNVTIISKSDNINLEVELLNSLFESIKMQIEQDLIEEYEWETEMSTQEELEKMLSQEEYIAQFMETSTISINNYELEQLTFTPFPYTEVPNTTNKFVFTYGNYKNNLFFSFSPNPENIVSNLGLAENEKIAKITENTSDSLGIGYWDIKETAKAISSIPSFSPYQAEINKFFEPFNDITMSSKELDENTVYSLIDMDIDVQKLSSTIEVIQEIIGFFEESTTVNVPEFENNLNNDQDSLLNETPAKISAQDLYSDTAESAWYSPYVEQAYELNIMTGSNGEFRPNEPINRAEFIKAFMAAQDAKGILYTTVEPQTYFEDVQLGTWYASAVNKAKAHDIVEGYEDNTFKPNKTITRAEAVQILYNASSTLKSDSQKTHSFSDVESEDWYFEAVNAAYNQFLISGKTISSFEPNQELTRAEAAKILTLYANLTE